MDGRNLNDPATVAAVLSEHGFDPDTVLALAADEDVKTALKDNTEQAIRRGVFGVPSIFVDDQLFFGQDRLDFVREALS
ncbi:2-hydroxychromene-2-carboxylate isomerase [compost metagenome]